MADKINEVVGDVKLTAKDFSSDIDVKWCPGCGDYSISERRQKTLFGFPAQVVPAGFRII